MFIATGFSDIDVEVDLNIIDIDIIDGWILFNLVFLAGTIQNSVSIIKKAWVVARGLVGIQMKREMTREI